ncbi:MAG: hypothetical protein J6Y98_01120 [Bacteroidales bacterium]|nr:hypothetical protein [Bacteroidales bacterium]
MIPKVIHYCWFSGEKYPPQIRACIKSWQKQLRDYDIVLWDGKRFDFDSVPFVKKCIEMRKWAFAADYIRLYAVYTMGGIYLDSDVLVLNTFEDLLENNAFWGIDANEGQQYYFPEAAVFGAVKGFTPLKEMMAFYEQLPEDEVSTDTFTRLTNVCDERNRTVCKPDGSPQLSTAPVVMESVLRKYGYQQTNSNQSLHSGIKIYAEPIIQNSNKIDTPQTIAHHQNASSWFYTDRGPLFRFCYNHPQLMPLYKKVEQIRERL